MYMKGSCFMLNKKSMDIIFLLGCNVNNLRQHIDHEEVMKFPVFSELYKNMCEDVAAEYFQKCLKNCLENFVNDMLLTATYTDSELTLDDADSKTYEYISETVGGIIMSVFRQWERQNEKTSMKKFTNETLLKYDTDSYFDE